MRAAQNGDIVMMMITSTGDETDVNDGKNLRRLALGLKVPIVTTVAGARATAQARPPGPRQAPALRDRQCLRAVGLLIRGR